MFGKKKEESQDYRYMSNVELACRFPQIANIKNANEELSRENCKLEEANAALQEELAKYKALYGESKNSQSANTSSGTVYTDPAVLKTIEERDRLEQEVQHLKATLEAYKNAKPGTPPAGAGQTTELAALKKELNRAADHAKNLEDALYNERAENAELKERLNNGGNRMSNEVTQWEYTKVNTEGHFPIDEINKLGKEGWESTGNWVSPNPNGSTKEILFKRPKQRDDNYGYSR